MTDRRFQNQTVPSQKIDFETAFALTHKEIERALSTAPFLIRGYTTHLMSSKGKNIRATAVLTCAMDQEALIHPDAVLFAASIELLHLATLVHDDVIDNADMRRGTETLQKKFGKKTAVICGDYLFSIALRMASSVPDKKNYLELDMPDYISRICLGELTQHLNNGNLNLSVHQYLKIIAGKTAALFEASFYAGAVLSSDNIEEHRKYRKLGHNIGMIFQLTDDCIDFESTEDIAQKPVQSDYEQNVITLPLIHALRQQIQFKEKTESGTVDRKEINEAVQKTGGLSFTRGIAKKYHDRSMAIVEMLSAPEDKKQRLQQILNKANR